VPFEPLKTDELLDQPAKTGPDWDTLMLMGCGGFILSSVIHFALSIWPHFVFSAGNELKSLGVAALLGLVPASIFAAIVVRRFGIPAAGGILGGSFATAIFLHLRLRQFDAGRGLPDFPQPEFPASWTWMAPMAWVIFTLIVTAACVRADDWNSLKEDGDLKKSP
jgi:hypothetical protein